jgi:hypothetical protein
VHRHEHCPFAPLRSHIRTPVECRRFTTRISPFGRANPPLYRPDLRTFGTPRHPRTIETPYSRECERPPSSRCIKSAPARPIGHIPTVCHRGASDTALRLVSTYRLARSQEGFRTAAIAKSQIPTADAHVDVFQARRDIRGRSAVNHSTSRGVSESGLARVRGKQATRTPSLSPYPTLSRISFPQTLKTHSRRWRKVLRRFGLRTCPPSHRNTVAHGGVCFW